MNGARTALSMLTTSLLSLLVLQAARAQDEGVPAAEFLPPPPDDTAFQGLQIVWSEAGSDVAGAEELLVLSPLAELEITGPDESFCTAQVVAWLKFGLEQEVVLQTEVEVGAGETVALTVDPSGFAWMSRSSLETPVILRAGALVSDHGSHPFRHHRLEPRFLYLDGNGDVVISDRATFWQGFAVGQGQDTADLVSYETRTDELRGEVGVRVLTGLDAGRYQEITGTYTTPDVED